MEKKIEPQPIEIPHSIHQAQGLSPEIVSQVSKIIAQRQSESRWLVPIIVFMVVGATIFLSVEQGKVEYVYSLAAATFGYYFGQYDKKYVITDERPADGSSVDQNNSF